jgi:zinc ribbon protein
MFKSEKFVPISVPDLAPVAQELAEHFKQRDYQVECVPLPTAGWEVGITRGGMFKAAVGLRSALKIQIEPNPAGTVVRAGAGVFGKQAIPTAITMFVAWPVLLTQVWGLVREAGLDGEAVKVVEVSLSRHQRAGAGSAGPGAEAPRYCGNCGKELAESARFCPGCGQASG